MLDVILVNWNSARQLQDAVGSIGAHHDGLVHRVVVVDNHSTDGSLEFLRQPATWPFRLQLVENASNTGFAAACNRGARLCNSGYLLFLNPDARLFAGSVALPLDLMRQAENADVGICGVQLIDEQGGVARSCARFPSLGSFASQALGLSRMPGLRWLSHHMEEWSHGSTRQVDHVIGAFYLIRRPLFEALGGFDERFFVYLEDVDLSLRAFRAGWRSMYLTGAQAFHAGGGTSRQARAARICYALRSRLLYGFKHFPPAQAWALVALTLLVEPVSRSVFSLLRGGPDDVRRTLEGYGMLWRELPQILAGRRR